MKKQMLKQASKIAGDLLDNKPTTTFISLWESADAMEYGSEEKKLADAVVSILEQRRAEAKAELNKLMADLDRLGLLRLEDGLVTEENMDQDIAANHNCIAHYPEYTRHTFNVVASRAQDEGIDINGLLGYAIY